MHGKSSLIRRILRIPYNRVARPFLPTKIAVYNGVPVKEAPLFDQKVTFPEYEGALIEAVRRYGSRGDSITQVGGGKGVSAVASAHVVGPNGNVIVYEGGKDYTDKIRRTLALNDVQDIVKVRTKIVGEDRDVWGNSTGVETIPPEELPDCDLLILDCEGAEQKILPRIECNPATLIVETHGELGSPTEDVKEKVKQRGYKIEEVSPEVPKDDIYVLTASLNKKR
ncbi:hypothetical protein [Natrinema sp. DC36]|uniref:hypothetical protein n=1 Tax=Natrinema sp. DC36 TaxID=2878680 RepID=UPI001CF0C147|nr:hypothetical protein [Natrinema sp. DC36]